MPDYYSGLLEDIANQLDRIANSLEVFSNAFPVSGNTGSDRSSEQA